MKEINRHEAAKVLGISYAKLTNIIVNRADLKFPQIPGRDARKCKYREEEIKAWAKENPIREIKWVNRKKSKFYHTLEGFYDNKLCVKFLTGKFDPPYKKRAKKHIAPCSRHIKRVIMHVKEINE